MFVYIHISLYHLRDEMDILALFQSCCGDRLIERRLHFLLTTSKTRCQQAA